MTEFLSKCIPVTNGAGLLGPHLCERLLSEGYEGLGVDDFFAGRRSNGDRKEVR